MSGKSTATASAWGIEMQNLKPSEIVDEAEKLSLPELSRVVAILDHQLMGRLQNPKENHGVDAR